MKFSFLIVALFVYSFGHAQDSDASKKANIIHIISLFKQKNIDEISTVINYPLKRENPIPSIKKPKEFKQRFYEVFDQKLVDLIAHSKPDQWTEVGWRGIMLDNGKLWIDSEGGKIIAVNYQSPFEKKLRQTLIQKQKEYIHHSLKQFKTPVYTIRSEKYLIRIDELANGKYRYASWKIEKKENMSPDIILSNGKMDFEGSGGNHVITFTNGIYTYAIYRNIIAEKDASDITLVVKKNKQKILTQGGTLIAE